MNVLWITNILLPEAEKYIIGTGCIKSSGGWMAGALDVISNETDVNIAVASPSSYVKDLVCLRGEKVRYYIFPLGKGNTKRNDDYKIYWRKIHEDFEPDIVHIHGTEFSHGLAYIHEYGSKSVVVSIQGLVSVISDYYNAGISMSDIVKNLTIRDVICGTVLRQQRNYLKRGAYEIELLKKVQFIIGRTKWDRAHVWAINPDAIYYHCDETLRPEFYDTPKWEYSRCVKHSIFMSQAFYPVKGLHMMLKALPLIIQYYPDVQLRIAGNDIINKRKGFLKRLMMTGYERYLLSLIKQNKLSRKIHFVGNLDAKQMRTEYLRSNVFICPSSIENSSNSIAEAQILGVPVVASYVGGNPDIMNDNNLYRFEEIEMLAYSICGVFSNKEQQTCMSELALNRYNRGKNCKMTMKIYKDILSKNDSDCYNKHS